MTHVLIASSISLGTLNLTVNQINWNVKQDTQSYCLWWIVS